jgi:hypothetical protein
MGHPCMFYIHPYEVGPIIPGLPALSFKRKFRHYYNCKHGSHRLRTYLRSFRFSPALDILKNMNVLNVTAGHGIKPA